MTEQQLWDHFARILYASYITVECNQDDGYQIEPSYVNGVGYHGVKLELMHFLYHNMYYGSVLRPGTAGGYDYEPYPKSRVPDWSVLNRCGCPREEILRELTEAYPEFGILEILYV